MVAKVAILSVSNSKAGSPKTMSRKCPFLSSCDYHRRGAAADIIFPRRQNSWKLVHGQTADSFQQQLFSLSKDIERKIQQKSNKLKIVLFSQALMYISGKTVNCFPCLPSWLVPGVAYIYVFLSFCVFVFLTF